MKAQAGYWLVVGSAVATIPTVAMYNEPVLNGIVSSLAHILVVPAVILSLLLAVGFGILWNVLRRQRKALPTVRQALRVPETWIVFHAIIGAMAAAVLVGGRDAAHQYWKRSGEGAETLIKITQGAVRFEVIMPQGSGPLIGIVFALLIMGLLITACEAILKHLPSGAAPTGGRRPVRWLPARPQGFYTQVAALHLLSFLAILTASVVVFSDELRGFFGLF
jgi:hypothetical protein